MTELDGFRSEVRAWCRAHVPDGWREAQSGAPDDEFVAFQRDWFRGLHGAGYAVPHRGSPSPRPAPTWPACARPPAARATATS